MGNTKIYQKYIGLLLGFLVLLSAGCGGGGSDFSPDAGTAAEFVGAASPIAYDDNVILPVGGRGQPDYMSRLRSYFERLSLGYQALRETYQLRIRDGFMCRRCAYMQMECDMDRVSPTQDQSN